MGMTADDAEAILHADRVGYEEAWVGDGTNPRYGAARWRCWRPRWGRG
jgi:hypothetical protein